MLVRGSHDVPSKVQSLPGVAVMIDRFADDRFGEIPANMDELSSGRSAR